MPRIQSIAKMLHVTRGLDVDCIGEEPLGGRIMSIRSKASLSPKQSPTRPQRLAALANRVGMYKKVKAAMLPPAMTHEHSFEEEAVAPPALGISAYQMLVGRVGKMHGKLRNERIGGMVEGLKRAEDQGYASTGDAYSPENLVIRERLRRSERLYELSTRWWTIIVRKGTSMTKKQYMKAFAPVYMYLVPGGSEDDAMEHLEEDWKTDAHGKRLMTETDFFLSLFNMADMWCDTTSEDDYVAFLQDLMENCTSHLVRKRSPRRKILSVMHPVPFKRASSPPKEALRMASPRVEDLGHDAGVSAADFADLQRTLLDKCVLGPRDDTLLRSPSPDALYPAPLCHLLVPASPKVKKANRSLQLAVHVRPKRKLKNGPAPSKRMLRFARVAGLRPSRRAETPNPVQAAPMGDADGVRPASQLDVTDDGDRGGSRVADWIAKRLSRSGAPDESEGGLPMLPFHHRYGGDVHHEFADAVDVDPEHLRHVEGRDAADDVRKSGADSARFTSAGKKKKRRHISNPGGAYAAMLLARDFGGGGGGTSPPISPRRSPSRSPTSPARVADEGAQGYLHQQTIDGSGLPGHPASMQGPQGMRGQGGGGAAGPDAVHMRDGVGGTGCRSLSIDKDADTPTVGHVKQADGRDGGEHSSALHGPGAPVFEHSRPVRGHTDSEAPGGTGTTRGHGDYVSVHASGEARGASGHHGPADTTPEGSLAVPLGGAREGRREAAGTVPTAATRSAGGSTAPLAPIQARAEGGSTGNGPAGGAAGSPLPEQGRVAGVAPIQERDVCRQPSSGEGGGVVAGAQRATAPGQVGSGCPVRAGGACGQETVGITGGLATLPGRGPPGALGYHGATSAAALAGAHHAHNPRGIHGPNHASMTDMHEHDRVALATMPRGGIFDPIRSNTRGSPSSMAVDDGAGVGPALPGLRGPCGGTKLDRLLMQSQRVHEERGELVPRGVSNALVAGTIPDGSTSPQQSTSGSPVSAMVLLKKLGYPVPGPFIEDAQLALADKPRQGRAGRGGARGKAAAANCTDEDMHPGMYFLPDRPQSLETMNFNTPKHDIRPLWRVKAPKEGLSSYEYCIRYNLEHSDFKAWMSSSHADSVNSEIYDVTYRYVVGDSLVEKWKLKAEGTGMTVKQFVIENGLSVGKFVYWLENGHTNDRDIQQAVWDWTLGMTGAVNRDRFLNQSANGWRKKTRDPVVREKEEEDPKPKPTDFNLERIIYNKRMVERDTASPDLDHGFNYLKELMQKHESLRDCMAVDFYTP